MMFRKMNQVRRETARWRPLLFLGTVMLVGVLAVACSAPQFSEAPTPTPVAIPLPPPAAEATAVPTAEPDDAYPGPVAPATPASGYPAPPVPALPSGYPGDTVWFVRPAGIQCEEPLYPDLDAAVAALQASGVIVVTAETVTVPVCQACDCPTSEHYRVEIPATAANTAAALEWTPE
jgi:hypothetical protein